MNLLVKIKENWELYKNKIISLLVITLIIITFITLFIKKEDVNESITAKVEEKNSEKIEEETETIANVPIEDASIETIKIDIKGAVKNPGVYELKVGSRVIDAINKAGGLETDAYTKYINLSQILKDENVIIINTLDEIEEIKTKENQEIICEDTNDGCIKEEDLVTSDIDKSETTNKEETKEKEENTLNTTVNINNASLEELMTINGIGESKAKSIIDYRTKNGPFKNVEDIKNVKGIGEAIYAKIKENITI